MTVYNAYPTVIYIHHISVRLDICGLSYYISRNIYHRNHCPIVQPEARKPIHRAHPLSPQTTPYANRIKATKLDHTSEGVSPHSSLLSQHQQLGHPLRAVDHV
jgi:hypothetical protein